MKTFSYTVMEELGIHARPAGMLAKTAKTFESEIVLEKGGRSVNVTKLMALMTMGVKCGDTVTVKISGPDEESAAEVIEKFFNENL